MKNKCAQFLKVKSKIYFHKFVDPRVIAKFLEF
jgi:hypothetical protein